MILKTDLSANVAVYFGEKGYGFLRCESERRQIFFHRSKFQRESDPVVGEQVVFDLALSKFEGKPSIGVNIRPHNMSATLADLLQGQNGGDGGAV